MKRRHYYVTLAGFSAFALAGCNSHDQAQTSDHKPSIEADTNPESGQDRAEQAGLDLIGTPAPAGILKTIDGDQIDLSQYYGRKPVYLRFWATWCVPCLQQTPGFKRVFEQYGDQIETVAVNTGFNDDLAAIEKYRAKHGLTMPIVMDDSRLGAALHLRVTPQHVVIGRDGRILYVGHLDDDRLHAALREAIAEAPAPAPKPASAAQGVSLGALEPQLATAAGFPLSGPGAGGKPRALIFFSPWCESYWKDSRPQYSANCRRMREEVNRIAATGNVQLLGIASNLWATDKDLANFRKEKDNLRIPLYLDAKGEVFRAFNVHAVPTVIILDDSGRPAVRLGSDDKGLSEALARATKRS